MSLDIDKVKQRFGIIGNSPLLNRAIEIAVQVAPTDMSVLIVGESGVGKETFPKIIHQNSIRKHNAYIAVNCGAIPEGTIDSELFGHVKGSFTGAIGDRKGYFEEADGGTIFLDEVGELPLATQARLLRVLETGEFIPVGASKPVKSDVRIVAATNVNLKDAVTKGHFREDLLFRLNTVPIEIPALRYRAMDIPFLFRFFAIKASEKYSMPTLRLSEEATEMLQKYKWPGNIRELRNITERMSILESERFITGDIIKNYLPDIEEGETLYPQHVKTGYDGNSFSNEREIMYQLLFDMKKDISDMKILIHNILSGKVKISESGDDNDSEVNDIILSKALPTVIKDTTIPNYFNKEELIDIDQEIVDDNILLDENNNPRSLQDIEKMIIDESMKRNKGKRKSVSKELNIAERTLYRKIKEYGLEDKKY